MHYGTRLSRDWAICPHMTTHTRNDYKVRPELCKWSSSTETTLKIGNQFMGGCCGLTWGLVKFYTLDRSHQHFGAVQEKFRKSVGKLKWISGGLDTEPLIFISSPDGAFAATSTWSRTHIRPSLPYRSSMQWLIQLSTRCHDKSCIMNVFGFKLIFASPER